MKGGFKRFVVKLRNGVLKLALAFLLFTFFIVLLFRFIHPPTSSIMMHKRTATLFDAHPIQIKYQWVDFEDVSPYVPLAVMAAEDQTFPEHFGFDFKAIQKAIKNNLRHPRRIRGGSTLSQQTAKNLFLWSRRSYLRKALEVYFTVLLELLWPKRRILEVYLNIAELGDGVYGVSAASKAFFNKPPHRLTVREASLLAAVLPSPRRYHANHPSGFVYNRSEWIEQQMWQMGGTAVIKALQNR